jgi:hypothetical protein
MCSRRGSFLRGDSTRRFCLCVRRDYASWSSQKSSAMRLEENRLTHAGRLDSDLAKDLIEDYRRLIQLLHPEMVKYPAGAQVRENRQLIRHEADGPVLLSAMASKPGWLLTPNTNHFTSAIAKRCGVRIATTEFFRILASRLD